MLPWKVARRDKFIKTEAIKLLMAVESRREPAQRSSTGYTGKRLDERVGANAANVESILMQVVGDISPQECTSCLKGNGPWAHCVVFHDVGRTVTACGNCQWNGNKSRCEFYVAPVGGEAALGHQRGRSSTSSTGSQQVAISANANVLVAASRRRVLEEHRDAIRQIQSRMQLMLGRLMVIEERIARHEDLEPMTSLRPFLPNFTDEDAKAEYDALVATVDQLLQMERGV